MPCRVTTDDGVAGPEQRSQAEQQVGLIGQPGEVRARRRGGGQWGCLRRLEEGWSCVRNRRRHKVRAGIGAMREGAPCLVRASARADAWLSSIGLSAGSEKGVGGITVRSRP